MDGWVRGFTSLSTVFQSYRDDGRAIFKGSVQWSAVYVREESLLKRDSNPRPGDTKLGPLGSQIWGLLISSHLSPLTLEVVGAPQMTLQQYLSILPCLPLPSGNLQTPFPSIPWCYLPISSSVFLSFLLLSLSLAELSSPCQRILRCGHTIWVSVSLPWLGDHHALQLHSGFCCQPPRSSHGLCRKCSGNAYYITIIQ